jgi:hypothetical protein
MDARTGLLLLTVGAIAVGGIYTLSQSQPEVPLEDPAISHCEVAVKSALKSPTSYKRERAATMKNEVHLTFDSQNSFGAMLRGAATCRFDYEPSPLKGSVGTFDLVGISINGRYLDPLARQLAVSEAILARLPSVTEGKTSLQKP